MLRIQYHTLLASNGARHLIVPGIYLGKKIDAEVDGQPNINAAGDDINETEDEDGIIFTGALNPGENSLIDVTASCPGFLNAWMDFNGDGDWTDEGEKILSDLVPGYRDQSCCLQCSGKGVAGRHIFPFPIQ